MSFCRVLPKSWCIPFSSCRPLRGRDRENGTQIRPSAKASLHPNPTDGCELGFGRERENSRNLSTFSSSKIQANVFFYFLILTGGPEEKRLIFTVWCPLSELSLIPSNNSLTGINFELLPDWTKNLMRVWRNTSVVSWPCVGECVECLLSQMMVGFLRCRRK